MEKEVITGKQAELFKEEIKVGMLVRHVADKNNEPLRVQRIGEFVATVNRVSKPREWRRKYHTEITYKTYPRWVCSINNLIPVK